MRIEKWYYSNLNARPEKIHAQELVAAIQGFPPDVLERYPAAIENKDLPDSMDELCEMIQADGFVEWRADALKDVPYLQNRRNVASNWTKLRMLRHVIESNQGAVLTTDNAYPIVPFSVIDQTLSSCPADLKALYLHWVAEPYEVAFQQRHYDALAGLTPVGIDGVLGNFTGVGWIAYFTPDGASAFLETWRTMPNVDGQSVCAEARRNQPLTGFYACNPHLALSLFDMERIQGNSGVISEGNPLIIKDK